MFLSAIQSIRFASQYRITNYFAEVIRHSSYEHEVGGIRNLEATIEDLPTLSRNFRSKLLGEGSTAS